MELFFNIEMRYLDRGYGRGGEVERAVNGVCKEGGDCVYGGIYVQIQITR